MLVHGSLPLCYGTMVSLFLPPLFHSTEQKAVMGRGQTLAPPTLVDPLVQPFGGELPAPWGPVMVGKLQGHERWLKSDSSCLIYTATHLTPFPVPSVTVGETMMVVPAAQRQVGLLLYRLTLIKIFTISMGPLLLCKNHPTQCGLNMQTGGTSLCCKVSQSPCQMEGSTYKAGSHASTAKLLSRDEGQ